MSNNEIIKIPFAVASKIIFLRGTNKLILTLKMMLNLDYLLKGNKIRLQSLTFNLTVQYLVRKRL